MKNHKSGTFNNSGDYVKLALKGFCMGVADVIPGISGGTIAFLLGIYEDLIEAIKSVDTRFVGRLCRLRIREAFEGVEWKFLVSVFAGIISAIVTLSKAISWMLHNEPVMIYSFFFGLILATVPIIARILKNWTPGKILTVLIASVCTYFIVGMVPLATPETWWFIFLSGAVAISAMILPGISGAFILVLLGKYQFLLDAVNQRDLFIAGMFGLGVVAGIVSFVRVLGWLFREWHDLTVALLTGVVIGSLRKVWPWKEIVRSITTGHGKIIPLEEINVLPVNFNGEVGWAVALMAIGFILALKLSAASEGKLLSS